jgi:hypothetical protein
MIICPTPFFTFAAELPTFLAAEDARLHGNRVKKHYPIVQIGACDGIDSVNKIIELP